MKLWKDVSGSYRLALSYLVFLSLFSFGEFSGIAPFVMINTLLFDGSVRVPTRFQLGVVMMIPFLIFPLYSYLNQKVRSLDRLFFAAGILGVLNFFSFSEVLKPGSFYETLSLPSLAESKIKTMDWGRFSKMYPTVLEGKGILDCYQPLRREVVFPILRSGQSLRVIFGSTEKSEDILCNEGSYLTQNEIVLSPHCSPDVCLNVNSINPHYGPDYKFNVATWRHCRQ